MYYERPPKKRSFFSYFLVGIIGAIIGGLIIAYIAPTYLYGKIIPMPEIYQDQAYPGTTQEISITPSDDISTVEAVAKKAIGSVVGITTVQIQREFIWSREVEGVGSGVIVDSNGYILTNSHVIADGEAKSINVLFEDDENVEGQVLWNDSTLDIAVVKVDRSGLPVAELGDSDSLEVGELAVAIGNPLGLEFQRSVTSGVISGLNRSVQINEYNIMENLIQTDASINPGNSGGPLLNSEGQVIGINTAKAQSGEGLGFAIPINSIKPIIEEVIATGNFESVYMGVSLMELDEFERQTGLNVIADSGLIIIEVESGSSADNAGLQANDVITKIDDQNIENRGQLIRSLYTYKKGDKVTVNIIRNGEEMPVVVEFTQAQ